MIVTIVHYINLRIIFVFVILILIVVVIFVLMLRVVWLVQQHTNAVTILPCVSIRTPHPQEILWVIIVGTIGGVPTMMASGSPVGDTLVKHLWLVPVLVVSAEVLYF